MSEKMKNAGELIKWKSYVEKNKELLKIARQLNQVKRPKVGDHDGTYGWKCGEKNCNGVIKEFFDD